ncbi:MAG TPA: TetR family transcriptional regulator, partial [Rhizomicrobium sp.]
MGSIASQEHADSGTPSEEGGARAAILDAARKVAQRDGIVEMTLTGVAKEASVAATDIYTFFTSKNDLLQAVVADDLATLAKAMRRNFEQEPATPTAVPEPVSPTPLAVVANEPEGAANEAAVESNQTQDIHIPPEQVAAPAPVQDLPRRFPVVQARREARSAAPDTHANAATGEAIAQLQEAVAKLQAAPVDQWLERRLREFERTLYTLQHNQNHRASSNVFEQGLQSLRESIEALDMRHAMASDESTRASGERFDAFDRRLRETVSDLQAESVHL